MFGCWHFSTADLTAWNSFPVTEVFFQALVKNVSACTEHICVTSLSYHQLYQTKGVSSGVACFENGCFSADSGSF